MTVKKWSIYLLLTLAYYTSSAQQEATAITTKTTDGKIQLTDRGVAYFTNLSMRCVALDTPHHNPKAIKKEDQRNYKNPQKDWPSFYGCFDWHSAVHNHWTLLKLLKQYPQSKLNTGIIARLDESFESEKIKAELKYLKIHELEMFEFPYGTSWVLKIAEELLTWKDPKAAKWLNNLNPLVKYIIENYKFHFPKIKNPVIIGNHENIAFGFSFAMDYAKAAKHDTLQNIIITAAKSIYGNYKNYDFDQEPYGFDIMSGGMLIADVMRKVSTQREFEYWFKKFAPKLLQPIDAQKLLAIKKRDKHDGIESHLDGFQLNRMWCLAAIQKSVSSNFLDAKTKKVWQEAQENMWNYAQESIGKNNYDIDHWLGTFSVFALEGYR